MRPINIKITKKKRKNDTINDDDDDSDDNGNIVCILNILKHSAINSQNKKLMILVGYYIEYLCRYFRKASNLLRNNENFFFEYSKNDDIVDLRPKSKLVGKLPREIYESYLKKLTQKLIT